jgi:hypothetical protein
MCPESLPPVPAESEPDERAQGTRRSRSGEAQVTYSNWLRGVPPAAHDRLSISGSWARGRTEDVFQAGKRKSIGSIN